MNCCRTNGGFADRGVPVLSAPLPATPQSNAIHRPWRSRIAMLIQWAVPLTTLALIPKCPFCVASYVLLLTGIGLSLSVAAAVRWTIIAVSIVALAYLLFRTARRALTPPA